MIMQAGSTYLGNNKTRFRVWAPFKESMILHIIQPSERKIEMEKDHEFFIIETDARPGTQYFFMPEGQRDLPDPQSLFQPHGVHGPSEVLDQSNFGWTDDGWRGIPFREIILYELHAGLFTQ